MVAPRKKRHGLLSQEHGGESAPILSALRVLDRLLASALSCVRETSTTEEAAAVEQFRGLYLTHDGVERLLAREPGAPAFSSVKNNDEDLPDPSESVARLRQLYAHSQDAFRLESRIDGAQQSEALNQQPRANQQHQG